MATKKKTQDTALAVSDFTALTMVQQESAGNLMETVNEFLSGGTLKIQHLQRAITPTGGGVMWTIKSGKGRPSGAESLDGIIIDAKRHQAWYDVSFEESGGGSPPACISLDLRQGVALNANGPGKKCAECIYNQWGSDSKGSGRGKACKERISLFILRQDRLLPMLISVPTTSLDSIDQYLISILDAGFLQYWRVMTRFSLEVTSGSGVPDYSWIQAENLGPVSADVYEQVTAYRNAFRPIIQSSMEALARISDAVLVDGEVAYTDPDSGEKYTIDQETGELIPVEPDSEPETEGADEPQGGQIVDAVPPVAAGQPAPGTQDELPL